MWKSIQNRLDSSESYVSLALGLAVVLVIGTLIFNALSRKTPQTGTTGTPESTISAEGKVPGKHTVKDGDTLWTLAEKYYQNAYNWVDIKAANPTIGDSNELVVGQQLSLPEVKPTQAVGEISATSTEVPAAAPATEEKPASGGRQVTVVRGDTLWAIAEREYSNPYKWVDIANANNLDNPDLIHAGNVFVLP